MENSKGFFYWLNRNYIFWIIFIFLAIISLQSYLPYANFATIEDLAMGIGIDITFNYWIVSFFFGVYFIIKSDSNLKKENGSQKNN